ERANQLTERNSGVVSRPLLGLLPFGEAANIGLRALQGRPQLGGSALPRRHQRRFRHANRLLPPEPIPLLRVAAQRAIAVPAHVIHNAPHLRFALFKLHAPRRQFLYARRGTAAGENPHHSTTLFSGYSTIPCAFAAFSLGITSQAVCSSITVFTA